MIYCGGNYYIYPPPKYVRLIKAITQMFVIPACTGYPLGHPIITSLHRYWETRIEISSVPDLFVP